MSISFLVGRCSMFSPIRIVVRTSRSTAISIVTKLVDMEPVQAGGQTSDGAAEAEIGNGGIFEKF